MSTTAQALLDRREAVVREHMESENRHEFEVTLQTFGHPRYEIIATGELNSICSGRTAVPYVVSRRLAGNFVARWSRCFCFRPVPTASRANGSISIPQPSCGNSVCFPGNPSSPASSVESDPVRTEVMTAKPRH